VIDLTIIMTSFEQEVLIGQAIRMLRTSAYLPHMELLVIDDASQEGFGIVQVLCQEAAEAGFGRVRLLRMDRNVGVSIVRNIGIEEAQGRYLHFHDGDDLWLDGWADGVEVMDRDGLLILTTGLRAISGPGFPEQIPPPVPPSVHPLPVFPLDGLPFAQTFLVAKRSPTRFKAALTRPNRFWPTPPSGEDNFHKIETMAEGPFGRFGEFKIFRGNHWGSEVNPPQWHAPTYSDLVMKAFFLSHRDLFTEQVIEEAEAWFGAEGLPLDDVVAEMEKADEEVIGESLTWWEMFCAGD